MEKKIKSSWMLAALVGGILLLSGCSAQTASTTSQQVASTRAKAVSQPPVAAAAQKTHVSSGNAERSTHTTAAKPASNKTASTPVNLLIVANQDLNVDNSVMIDQVITTGPAWIVVYADDHGNPGAILGYTHVNQGETENVRIELENKGITSTLHVMLHTDAGKIGVFEYPGVDMPIKSIEGQVISMTFHVTPKNIQ